MIIKSKPPAMVAVNFQRTLGTIAGGLELILLSPEVFFAPVWVSWQRWWTARGTYWTAQGTGDVSSESLNVPNPRCTVGYDQSLSKSIGNTVTRQNVSPPDPS